MLEGTGSQSTALGSVASLRIAQEKPPAWLGMFPRNKPRKRRVCLLPRMPTASCGPFFPLRQAWKPERAWHRPGMREYDWICLFRAFPPPLRETMSRSHASFLRLSRTEKRQKKPWGAEPLVECYVESTGLISTTGVPSIASTTSRPGKPRSAMDTSTTLST